MKGSTGTVYLRASTSSEIPTTVKWQCKDWENKYTMRDDPDLTVTGLSEKPSDCEITISLSEAIGRAIREPGVAGVYMGDGSYCNGRPVLQHSEGYTLYVQGACWRLSFGLGGHGYLYSGTAPSLCPADPRASRNVLREWSHWEYKNKKGEYTETKEISVKCNEHNHTHTNNE